MESLRAKLLGPFIAGSIVLTILLAGYTYTSARTAVKEAMTLISSAQTGQVDGSMTLLYKSSRTAVQNMVVDQHVTALFSPEGRTPEKLGDTLDWMNIVAQGNDYYRDILIVDARGICIASSNLSHIGNSFMDKGYVRLALQGRFNFGDSSVGLVTKKFSATAAGPIDNADGVAGALVLINDFPKIVDYQDKDSQGNSRTIFTAMLTPEGLFMAHKDKELMGNEARLYPDLYKELAQVGEQGDIVSYSLDGRQYVGYAKVEPTNKWLVVSSGPEDEVFAPATKVGLVVLGISLAFLCIIGFLVVRFANGILSSLFSLINYAREVSEGDFELELGETTRHDELGVLHESLQRLVHALRAMLVESEKASTMKGQFLANMSHEIRTPLNAIIGMAHLSQRDGDLPQKQQEYLDRIQVAAKSLLGLINDILDISKIDADMLELEERPFNLKETLEDILSMFQESASAKCIALTLDYEEGTPLRFVSDPLRIGQIVNNLLSNALKFTKTGSVTVRCAQVASGGQDDARALLRISVTDTGIGMPEAALASLFQPFTQADASITRQYGGTGLGLAISKRLVSFLGGELSVQSEEGRGTTFSFTMLLTPAGDMLLDTENAAPVGRAFELLKLDGKRILIAEDNAINQLIMQELIAPTGATVIMVDNGLQAVNAVREQAFDLVFMDMQMPVMDGLEATRQIRTFMAADVLPIVAVTANAFKEDRDKGFASGMNDYLTKPIEPEHLITILHTWLASGEKTPE